MATAGGLEHMVADLDACFSLVADRLRRRLIQQLRANARETTTDVLVESLHRDGPDSGGGRDLDRDQLASQLHHVHLPKLEAHGIVERDLERGTVRYLPDARIEALLDLVPEEPSQASP